MNVCRCNGTDCECHDARALTPAEIQEIQQQQQRIVARKSAAGVIDATVHSDELDAADVRRQFDAGSREMFEHPSPEPDRTANAVLDSSFQDIPESFDMLQVKD